MSRKLSIAICEDQDDDAKSLSNMIVNTGILSDIKIFHNAENLIEAQKQESFELLFLDIYLKSDGMSGMDLARKMRTMEEDCEIVFTTVSESFALYGFEVNALQYLVKPLTDDAVTSAIQRYIQIRNRRDLNYCTVVVNRVKQKVFFRDIYYIESNDKYCQIHTKNGIIETYSSISKLEEKLPVPPFLRCHRGYIVNMDYVSTINNHFEMINGDSVMIPQMKLAKVKKDYFTYLSGKVRENTYESN